MSSPETQHAKSRFYAAHGVPTRTVVRTGPRSVSWAVYADLEHAGSIPATLVAGGVADTPEQADAQLERRFSFWTINGIHPLDLMVGRAGL